MINTSAGLTLIESITVVMMITVLTAMSFTAIPALRSHQELVADTEKIRQILLDAKQRTLNQVRPQACLDSLGIDANDPDSALCSDVGLALEYGEIIEFANTYHDGPTETFRYDYDYGGSVAGDYVISRSKPVTTVNGGTGGMSLLFRSVPPSVVLYNDGVISGSDGVEKIKLTASNGSERNMTVHSFGTIDIE